MPTQPELKPCPYQHKKHRGMSIHFTEDYYCYILCDDCGAHGPAIFSQDFDNQKQAAIEAWNTRSTPSPSRKWTGNTLMALIRELPSVRCDRPIDWEQLADAINANHQPLTESMKRLLLNE